VLRIKFSAGRQFSITKSASSPSAKPLAAIIRDSANLNQQNINQTEKNEF